MAKLVDDDAIYKYLGISPDDDDPDGVVLGLRDAAEELLENETNAVYGPQEVLTQDPYDGPGGHLLYVRRPIASLDKIEFRYLPEVTQELYFNLDITQYITWQVGKRRIYSHVYPFPCGHDNVLISYTARANQPALAIAAINDLVSAAWGGKGHEDAKSVQSGSYQSTLLSSLDDCRIWAKAVANLHVPLIG